MAVKIREWRNSDIDFMYDLNESCVPSVNQLSKDALRDLIAAASYVRIAETKMTMLGAVVGFVPGAHYDSENYKWFSERFDQFLYIDRIMVAKRGRKQSVGRSIYNDAIKWADANASGRITCEINTEPPNPASISFHENMGFEQIGTQAFAPGVKEVAYYLRGIADAATDQEN